MLVVELTGFILGWKKFEIIEIILTLFTYFPIHFKYPSVFLVQKEYHNIHCGSLSQSDGRESSTTSINISTALESAKRERVKER